MSNITFMSLVFTYVVFFTAKPFGREWTALGNGSAIQFLFVSGEKGVWGLFWFGLGLFFFLIKFDGSNSVSILLCYLWDQSEFSLHCSKDFFWSLPVMAVFFFLCCKLQFIVPFLLSRTFEKHNLHALQTNIEFIETCKPVNCVNYGSWQPQCRLKIGI